MNTTLRCLLLDDELPGLTLLKLLCEEIVDLEVVKAFNNPKTFLSEISALEFDLCILDIEMPGLNGIQVAKALEGRPVIFTTAYKEFAADAFELNAIDYVLKPVKKERLEQAVKKAVERHTSKKNSNNFSLQLLTSKGRIFLQPDQVYYIRASESDSRDKVVHLLDGTTVRLKNVTFEKLLELINDERFCRINRKELVSKQAVQSFTADSVVIGLPTATSPTVPLTLTNSYRAGFLQMMKS